MLRDQAVAETACRKTEPAGTEVKSMRLFVAVLVNEEIRDALAAVQDRLLRQGVKGTFTREENFHLTLAFIGEYPDPAAVEEILDSIPMEPFPMRLKGFGMFGDVWWIGIEDCPELETYVRRLRHLLADAGIPFDRKGFMPHLTLVRDAQPGPCGLPAVRVPDAGMTVEHISLMRSDRGKQGMIYTELY